MFQIDVVAVRPLPKRHLALTFEDGLQATLNLDRIIKAYTGVFAPLLDESYFKQVRLEKELGTVSWPNGADLCPDVLYSLASGKPRLAEDEMNLA
ncbi:MAG: DUF2442 domain-containing protein [Gammaproteobacteria bacterium]|nr:DUF2442 domain-containing protein [Gammaproteobacteria bacterium]